MRIRILLAACLAILMLLAGCGEPAEPIETPEPTPAPTPTPTESVPDPTPTPRYVSEVITRDTYTKDTGKREGTSSVTLTILGDCAIGAGLNSEGAFNQKAAEGDKSYFLSGVYEVTSQDDFTICNVETVLSDRDLAPVGKDYAPAYWFKGPASNAWVLTEGSVEVCSVSNNHTGDYGDEGYADTKQALRDAALLVGSSDNIVYMEKDGFRIALICNGLWSIYHADNIIPRVREASEHSDFQIVYFHGGTEFTYEPDDWKVDACHRIADAGADLIIGNHPHVLQPHEIYHDVPIVYSISNFLIGTFAACDKPTAMWQVQIDFEIGTNKITNFLEWLTPCYCYSGNVNDFRPVIISDPAAEQRVLDFMYGRADNPNLE